MLCVFLLFFIQSINFFYFVCYNLSMRSNYRILFIICIFFIGVSFVSAKERVTFSKCVDGDTFKVEVNGNIKTVRMLAVDTPESVHPTKGVEFYGKEASNFTCEMVTNAKNLKLEYDDNSDKEDKYDRLLAWVWVDDVLLQDELIKNGYAEVAYLYDDYKYTSLLEDHQRQAEISKIGIWNEEDRKEFDSENIDSNSTTSEDDETINFDEMSTKEIIILVVVVILLTIFEPTIKKYKKKLNKILK